jgi:Cu2+-exporting ATPase
MADACFHCGQAVPEGATHAIEIGGLARPMCCAGCAAAARFILEQGLGRYYEFRSPDGAPVTDGGVRDWSIYDRDAALRRYTHLRSDGDRDTTLAVDGMHCAACGWLIETSLRGLRGVTDIHVNPAGARAELTWDPARVSLSGVLARIRALGYAPRPLAFAAEDTGWRTERNTALRRLAVAGLGMMQVMTYAVGLYAGALEGIDEDMAALLRFVSMLVATPVVLYAAQPFFAGAWRSLRARTLGMDVPVALGIGGAYLWSVWATLRGAGEVWFDSAVMFTFFLLLGRFVEMSLRHRSGLQGDALARLLPEGVLRVADERVERVTPDELAPGDVVRVLPASASLRTARSPRAARRSTRRSSPASRCRGRAWQATR